MSKLVLKCSSLSEIEYRVAAKTASLSFSRLKSSRGFTEVGNEWRKFLRGVLRGCLMGPRKGVERIVHERVPNDWRPPDGGSSERAPAIPHKIAEPTI